MKHMGLAKYSEQKHRIQHKSRKATKFMKSFLKGNHFRKALALTSKLKLTKENLCPLKKLCPRVMVLLRRLGMRWASRDNLQFLKGNHFRNATTLMSKTKVLKKKLYLLKKLWPRVNALKKRLGWRRASRDNQKTSKTSKLSYLI